MNRCLYGKSHLFTVEKVMTMHINIIYLQVAAVAYTCTGYFPLFTFQITLHFGELE